VHSYKAIFEFVCPFDHSMNYDALKSENFVMLSLMV